MRAEVVPVGWVESSLARRDDAPKQGWEGAPDARVLIEPAYRPGLDRLEAGQDLLILTWLHQSRRDVLATHPRDDHSQPLTGVFATRSPDRPNPIGLHRVRILEVDGARVRVSGLEALDGTPVLDIKPVLGDVPER